MRIGLVTPPEKVGQYTLAELLEQIEQAEADGFASYWLVQLPLAGQDVLTAIALAGSRTSRIELGTAVISVYSRHPLTLAQQALSTQAATGGRFTLGVGLSHKPVVEAVMGLSYNQPARYMREYLSILSPLVNQQPVQFTGESLQVQAQLHVADAAPVPVLIAALAPMMLHLAGELAGGTVTWMAGIRTIAEHVAPRISAAANAAGRPAPRICVGLPVAVTDDETQTREQISQTLLRYGQLANYRRMLDIEGADGPGDVALVGNEDAVTAQLHALATAGATDLAAAIFADDEDSDSAQRTRALLRSLQNKII